MKPALIEKKQEIRGQVIDRSYLTLDGNAIDLITLGFGHPSMDLIRAAVIIETMWATLNQNWSAVYRFYKAHPEALPPGVQLED